MGTRYRKKLSPKKSKRRFMEGAVKENKMNNRTVDRGGIRL